MKIDLSVNETSAAVMMRMLQATPHLKSADAYGLDSPAMAFLQGFGRDSDWKLADAFLKSASRNDPATRKDLAGNNAFAFRQIGICKITVTGTLSCNRITGWTLRIECDDPKIATEILECLPEQKQVKNGVNEEPVATVRQTLAASAAA